MRIESIKARLRRHDRQRMRYGYSDETAPQIWERELRALLKVAEAAADQAVDNCGDRDTPGACQRCGMKVCAAISGLEEMA